MFLDTANLEEIEKNVKLGFFKGVTTNPTLLLKEKEERFQHIDNVLERDVDLVFVQVIGDTIEEFYEDYDKICKINPSKNVGIKVPMNTIGMQFVKEIKAKSPERSILGTAIYSADQGILSSLVGCDYIAPYVNRMSNNNLDPYASISQMRQFIDDRSLKTKIMAASFKNTNQVIDALMAGAHTATIPADLVEKMVNKELAVNAINVFNEHGRELQKNQ